MPVIATVCSDKLATSGPLQPLQFGVDGGSTGEAGVKGVLPGVHRGPRDVIDDTTLKARFNLEAKPRVDCIPARRVLQFFLT